MSRISQVLSRPHTSYWSKSSLASAQRFFAKGARNEKLRKISSPSKCGLPSSYSRLAELPFTCPTSSSRPTSAISLANSDVLSLKKHNPHGLRSTSRPGPPKRRSIHAPGSPVSALPRAASEPFIASGLPMRVFRRSVSAKSVAKRGWEGVEEVCEVQG